MNHCTTQLRRQHHCPLHMLFLLLLLFPILGACDSALNSPEPFQAQETGVVLNSVEISLTIFPVDDPSTTVTVGLGADGTPVGFSLRDGIAAVPMGTYPAVVIVDVADGTVLREIALPEGSGASGSAFLNDSILLVANPDLNTVSPVNIRSGTRGPELPTGAYPNGIVVHGGKAFVLNAELGADWQPARSGSITVIDAAAIEVLETIDLQGENPAAGVIVNGTLYVLNSGRWGEGSGSLSVVDPDSQSEIGHTGGFGDFPGSLTAGPDGMLSVTSWSFGVALWNSTTSGFVRSPEDAITPGGVPSAAGSGFDSEGRLYVLAPECQSAATVIRMTMELVEDVTIPVGVCPAAIDFVEIEVATDDG